MIFAAVMVPFWFWAATFVGLFVVSYIAWICYTDAELEAQRLRLSHERLMHIIWIYRNAIQHGDHGPYRSWSREACVGPLVDPKGCPHELDDTHLLEELRTLRATHAERVRVQTEGRNN